MLYIFYLAAGPYVTLTVKPPDGNGIGIGNMPSVGFLGGNGGRTHHHLSSNERVTAPLPVNVRVLSCVFLSKK
jgi:hypothetical protein